MDNSCRKFVAGFTLALAFGSSARAENLALPPRPADAPTGSQFKDVILNLARDEREVLIYREIMSGNVPDFSRDLKPVTLSQSLGGSFYTLTYYVTPDYLSVGSNADYFRLPMSPLLAQWIADATSCSLPTRKMVNQVWGAAPCKLSPSSIPPSGEMITVPVFWQHQQTVQAQRNAAGNPLGDIVAGHKKDVVITPQLYNPSTLNSVAIYGWHYLNGTNIQPLYLGHEKTYADYSHGIRLVSNAAKLNGSTATLQSILLNPTLAPLLSDESVAFTANAPPRYNAGSPPAGFPYSDSFPATGRELSGWVNRFTMPVIQAFSPAAPGGDGSVLVVRDPGGGIDTTRLGYATDADYMLRCSIYCRYRPELAGDGFERVGIFARDNGNGMFCGTNSAGTIKGGNYALTWDSHNGRVQCLRTVNGVPVDMLSTPLHEPTSAWRLFSIKAVGSRITFFVDNTEILSVLDSTHPTGPFGIGYQEQFATNSNLRGTYADNFFADIAETDPSRVTDWNLYK